jgi:hypothetical protein
MDKGISKEKLKLYLKVLGKGKALLKRLGEQYQRLSEVNPYKSKDSVYYQARRLEGMGIIECTHLNRAKFCRLTELGKALKELLMEEKGVAPVTDPQALSTAARLLGNPKHRPLSKEAVLAALSSAVQTGSDEGMK